MAIREVKIRRLAAQREAAMEKTILAEMQRRSGEPSPPDAPVIYREAGWFRRSQHYYVVWEQFRGVDAETRSQLIYEALRRHDETAALHASVIMGLTPEEAEGLGLSAA